MTLRLFLITSPGAGVSTNLMANLAERGTPVVICGRNFRPTAMLWSLDQHHEQAGRFQSQVMLTKPRKKSIWQQIVRQKVLNQYAALSAFSISLEILRRLASEVKSGDPGNVEAQAARYYWRSLFGSAFRRDVDQEGINAQLNYGYAVLRAMVARAICAAGLHPSLGIFHSDPKNSFQLVDDLMEPFRPLVDLYIREFENETEVSTRVKKRLASIAEYECKVNGERSALSQALHRFVRGYVDVVTGTTTTLEFPDLFPGSQ